MRIVGGRFRGRALTPLGKGDAAGRLRPTSDRVRESLFNILAHGGYPDIEAARVLDLFAGTGALGLEALSREAAHVTFVEKGRVGRELIGKNTALLGCADATRLIAGDATTLGAHAGARYTVCFLDPPYGKSLGAQALTRIRDGGWLAPGALVVLEEGADVALPEGYALQDTRRYGDTVIHIALAL